MKNVSFPIKHSLVGIAVAAALSIMIIFLAACSCSDKDDAPPSSTSKLIGSTGGVVKLGQVSVSIPPNLLSQEERIVIRRLPSLANSIAQDLNPDHFKPLGEAYEIAMPFVSQEQEISLTFTYDPKDVPTGFVAQNLTVVVELDCLTEALEDASSGTTLPAERITTYVPRPVTVDEQAHEVTLNIYAGNTYQLVAMSRAINVLDGPLANQVNQPQPIELMRYQTTIKPIYQIEWVGISQDIDPADQKLLEDEINTGMIKAYQVLVVEQQFVAPEPVKIVLEPASEQVDFACATPNENGEPIIVIDPFRILNSPSLFGQFQATLTHEYFHVIQMWNSNDASEDVFAENAWFIEGTAGWAADLAYETSKYYAPTGERFLIPLNIPSEEVVTADHYETIVFWKWLESSNARTIWKVVTHHALRTLPSNGKVALETDVKGLYLDDLLQVTQNLDFLDFAKASLFWKGFEEDEKGPLDLWSKDKLGPPRDVPAYFREPNQHRVYQLKKGGEGDGEDQAVEITAEVTSYLTADLVIVANSDGLDALTGSLYLEFSGLGETNVKAVVIERNTGKEIPVEQVGSSPIKIALPFAPKAEVIVILVDDTWQSPPPQPAKVYIQIKAWVEIPCGELPTNLITVSTAQELVNAFAQANPGDTIKLAPGSYTFKGLWPQVANPIIPPYVTLAGSGPDQTTIVLSGSNSGLGLSDGTAIRNLSVKAYWWQGIVTVGEVHTATLCDVNVMGSNMLTGMDFIYVKPGQHTFKVYASTFTCTGSQADCDGDSGIRVRPYMSLADEAQSVTLDIVIDDTITSGWGDAAAYIDLRRQNDLGKLEVDCSQLKGNTRNVVTLVPSGNHVVATEHCPNP